MRSFSLTEGLKCVLGEANRRSLKHPSVGVKCALSHYQVDLQSTTKEKDRISLELQKLQSVKGNMDEVRRENQELSRRLSQQDSLERAPKDDLTVL